MIVVVFSVDGAPTISVDTTVSGTGWTIHHQTAYSTTVKQAILSKIATGSDVLTLTTSAAEQSSHACWRISGANSIYGNVNSGSSANATTASSTNPNVGQDFDYLTIIAASWDSTVVATEVDPDWTGLVTIAAAGTGGASTAIARDTFEITFNYHYAEFLSASEQWVTTQMVVWNAPPPAGDISGSVATSSVTGAIAKGVGAVIGAVLTLSTITGALTNQPTVEQRQGTVQTTTTTTGALYGKAAIVGSSTTQTTVNSTISGKGQLTGVNIAPFSACNATVKGLAQRNASSTTFSSINGTVKGQTACTGASFNSSFVFATIQSSSNSAANSVTQTSVAATLKGVGRLQASIASTSQATAQPTAQTGMVANAFGATTVSGILQARGRLLVTTTTSTTTQATIQAIARRSAVSYSASFAQASIQSVASGVLAQATSNSSVTATCTGVGKVNAYVSSSTQCSSILRGTLAVAGGAHTQTTTTANISYVLYAQLQGAAQTTTQTSANIRTMGRHLKVYAQGQWMEGVLKVYINNQWSIRQIKIYTNNQWI